MSALSWHWPTWSAEFDEKTSELSTGYDLKAAQLDLPALQREWTEACASNVLMRSGRKKKVRLHLQPYCTGEVPDEIGRDLVVLQDLADLLRETGSAPATIPRASNGCGEALDTDPSHVAAVIKWAGDLQDAVDAFQIDGVPREHLLAHVAGHLTHDISRFRPGGQVRRAFDAMHQAFPAMHQAAKELGACIGLDRPEEIIRLEPGWIEALLEQTARWKANVDQGPAMGDLARGGEEGASCRPLAAGRRRRGRHALPVTRSPVHSIMPMRGGSPRPSSTRTRC